MNNLTIPMDRPLQYAPTNDLPECRPAGGMLTEDAGALPMNPSDRTPAPLWTCPCCDRRFVTWNIGLSYGWHDIDLKVRFRS